MILFRKKISKIEPPPVLLFSPDPSPYEPYQHTFDIPDEVKFQMGYFYLKPADFDDIYSRCLLCKTYDRHQNHCIPTYGRLISPFE